MEYTPAKQVYAKRERNKMHAKKTRERKRHGFLVLQSRIEELKLESDRLRQMIDDHYMAITLLILSRGSEMGGQNFKSTSEICGDFYMDVAKEQGSDKDHKEEKSPTASRNSSKKLTFEEKEIRRRERNRLHAIKTRVKTRLTFELKRTIICEMTKETKQMKNYLYSIGMISAQEIFESDLQTFKFEQDNGNLLRPSSDNTKRKSQPGLKFKVEEDVDGGSSRAENMDRSEESKGSGDDLNENSVDDEANRSESGSPQTSKKALLKL